MVKSTLDKQIEYTEARDIDKEDVDFDANLYETQLYGRTIVFALGKPKYTYIDKNIVYYPMYLVEKDEIKMQLGLYEILANTQTEILDAEGDIDLNKFDRPLLYAFTLEEMGKTHAAAKGTTPATTTKGTKAQPPWIQLFMDDPNYGLIDTKYDGNCFFNVLRLALEENGQDISVDEMRDVLANNVTEELFQTYKLLYENFKTNEASLTQEIKNITARFNALQAKIKKMKDRSLQMNLIEQSDDMKIRQEILKEDRKTAALNLTDFEFMEGIDSLSMLKLKMKTKEYWADTWAISTLEREINIKVILFSELTYRQGDDINTLQCGQNNDTELEERGIFEPSFYVLASHHGGYHYQMITYNTMKSFTFEELPPRLIDLIREKCLERMAGPYSLIKEFTTGMPLVGTPAALTKLPEEEMPLPAGVEPLSDLYDNSTVFRFYIKSTDKPPPGKGAGERLGPEGSAAYAELAHMPQWRKKLSNAWPAEFKLDGHKWLTVEHYYQAAKFKKNNRAFYIQFSLDSKDSSLAKDVILAEAAGSRSGKLNGELLRPKDVVLDADFFNKGSKFSRGEIETENAIRAKFTQHADLKALLLATKKAKLEHIVRGKPSVLVNDLMRVRRELQ